MNRNNRFINDVLYDLKRTSKYLSEAYVFNEEGPMDGMEMEGPHQPEPMMRGQGQPQGEYGGSEEEQAMHAQEVIQHEPIIGKIRETAIEGLKKYADHPTSSLYEFFKKVFLESDKVLTDTSDKK